MEFSREVILQKILGKIDKNKSHYSRLRRYYEGDHDILYAQTKSDFVINDIRVHFNYCRRTINNYVGYTLGNPVTYGSRNDNKELLNTIYNHFGHWEKKHNNHLMTISEVYGHAFEVSFSDTQGNFRCGAFSPEEMAVQYDGSIDGRIKLAVRKYKMEFDEAEYIEVWDDRYKYLYKGDFNHNVETKEHLFPRCPVRELSANDSKKSSFSEIMGINDAYNLIASANIGEIADQREAYLAIEDAEIKKEVAMALKALGILQFPNGGKAKWLVKDINAVFNKDTLELLKDNIYKQTHAIDMNENFQSNTSSLSLRARLQELENLISVKEAFLESLLKQRIEDFCTWYKLKHNFDYDHKELFITFTRKVPVDLATIMQMVRDLHGIVPLEMLLAQIPFINDPQAAMRMLEKEKSRDIEGYVNELAQRNAQANE